MSVLTHRARSNALLLVRHGQTPWSLAGRHTGLTDVPLDDEGERQAAALRPELGGVRPATVLTSPLQRAVRTAQLAGLDVTSTDADLVEWDYGGYEGLTTEQIRRRTGTDWTVFADGVVPGSAPGSTPGETLAQVGERADAVLRRVRAALPAGDVVLVGHGHALRVLAARWLGADPVLGAHLLLHPATVSVLGEQHGVAAVVTWNVAPGPR